MNAKTKRYSRYLLVMAGLGGLLYGVDLGVIAAALPYINGSSNYSQGEIGAVVGFVLWGSVISSLFAGQLSEWLGRKKVIILSALCFVISIPVICYSGTFEGGNFALISVGRILQGMAGGLIGVIVPMYLAECLAAEKRGSGTAMFQLVLTIGLVFAALIGLIVTYYFGAPDKIAASDVTAEMKGNWTIAWQVIFWCCLIPGIILLVGAFKLKESPRWLYKKGRYDEALASLAANNGEEKAKEIYAEIEEAAKNELAEKDAIAAEAKKETLWQKKYIYPFLLSAIILICTQATGMNSVLNYSVSIYKDCGLEGEFANWSDLAIKTLNFIMTIVAITLVDKKGRKFLLKLGTAGIIVGQVGVGTMFLLINTGILQPTLTTGVITTIFFFIFVAFFAVGPGVCVWLALSEFMPTRIRANGMAIGMVLNQATSATIASIFPSWVEGAGMHTVFYVLAGCTVIYFLVVTFLMPETKGKTLEEVAKYFE